MAADPLVKVAGFGVATEAFTALKNAIPAEELASLQKAMADAELSSASLGDEQEKLRRSVEGLTTASRVLSSVQATSLVASFRAQTFAIRGAEEASSSYLAILAQKFPLAYKEVNAGVLRFIQNHKDLGAAVLGAKFNIDTYRLALREGNLEVVSFQRALLTTTQPLDNLATSVAKFSATADTLKLKMAGEGGVVKTIVDMGTALMRAGSNEASGNILAGLTALAASAGALSAGRRGLASIGGKGFNPFGGGGLIGSAQKDVAQFRRGNPARSSRALGRLATRGAVAIGGAAVAAPLVSEQMRSGEFNLASAIGSTTAGAAAGASLAGPYGAVAGAALGASASLGQLVQMGLDPAAYAARRFARETEEMTRGVSGFKIALAVRNAGVGTVARSSTEIIHEQQALQARKESIVNDILPATITKDRTGTPYQQEAAAQSKVRLAKELEEIEAAQNKNSVELTTGSARRVALAEQEMQIATLQKAPASAILEISRKIYAEKAKNYQDEKIKLDQMKQGTIEYQEQQGKVNATKISMLESVNYVRRSMLENMVGDAMSSPVGASATMPRNLNRAQIEGSGSTAGAIQTSGGGRFDKETGQVVGGNPTFTNPNDGTDLGPNKKTYGEELASAGYGNSRGSGSPAQQQVDLLKAIVEKLDKQIEATIEAGDKPLTLQQ